MIFPTKLYSKDTFLRFLTGETYTNIEYGAECKIKPLNTKIFDLKLGQNYYLDIVMNNNFKYNKIRYVGKKKRIQKFFKNYLNSPDKPEISIAEYHVII